MSVTLSVRGEVLPLELIVTSPPSVEFDRMEPANLERFRQSASGELEENPDYLLFDDLVLLSALRAEHRQLTEVIEAVVGEHGHYTFRHLLASTLHRDQVRADVIAETLALEAELYGADAQTLEHSRGRLEGLDATRLADALITGRIPHDAEPVLRWPLPNVLFARDLAAVCGEAIVLTYAARPARRRDMLLSRTIFTHHPLLEAVPKVDIGAVGEPSGGPPVTLEGGDVQVISEDVVVVGVGDRTTMSAVERLAPALFARGFSVVLGCELPKSRSAMHLDTVFTRIDEERCLIFPPMVDDPQSMGIAIHRFRPGAVEDAGHDLLAELSRCGVPLEPVRCGGDDPVQQRREQWSDGANAFALAPGVIVTYARNTHTLRELNRVGYEIVEPAAFVRNAALYLTEQRKIAVALRGHELVRGRGGPRCLTLPLSRSC